MQASTVARGLEATDHVAVRRLDTDVRWPRWCAAVGRIRYLRTLLRMCWFVPRLVTEARRADVVHVFAAAYWAFVLVAGTAVAVARMVGTPVIVNYHSGEAPDHLRRHPRLVAHVLRRAAALVVPSRFLADVFEKQGFTSLVIPNAVHPVVSGPVERVPPYDRYVCTRNHEPWYDVPTVVRAFGQVHRRVPSARLTLVGTGSQEGRVRDLTRELGLQEAVRIVGGVSHERIGSFYREADVFLNASRIDNQPLSILEAMSAGLFVISTDTGGIGELLEGGAGRLVPAGRPDLMRQAALDVVNDRSAFTRAVRRAKRRVAEHDADRITGAWHRLYRKVARDSQGRRSADAATRERLDSPHA